MFTCVFDEYLGLSKNLLITLLVNKLLGDYIWNQQVFVTQMMSLYNPLFTKKYTDVL